MLRSFLKTALGPILWGGSLVGEENLPKQGPAVFIANHMDGIGPVAIYDSVPLTTNAWVIADIVDRDLAPAYFQADLVERQWHFRPPVSRWISRPLSVISVAFLKLIGSIPVYRCDYDGMHKTMEISLRALREGKILLIFPEDPRLPADPVTKMNPFMHSFARLGELYFAETGECLEFYPLTVHPKKYVVVGKPVAFDPHNPVVLERRRLKDLMEETIKATYLL